MPSPTARNLTALPTKTVKPTRRPLPVAHLSHVWTQASAAAHVAAALPAVRRGPGQGKQSRSAGFPFVEFTVRECQDAIQIGLVQIRKRLIDAANELLDDGGVPAVRAASRVIVENFPPVARVADVSDGEQFEDLSDIPDAELDRMKEIRDAARAKNEQTNLEE